MIFRNDFFMKRRFLIVFILILAGLFSLYLNRTSEYAIVAPAMNTLTNITVYAHDGEAVQKAYNLLSKLDDAMSMYNPSSDISFINANAGLKKIYAQKELIEVIKNAVKLYEITDGVFNPLIGAITKLWKINTPDSQKPSQDELDKAIKLSDISNLELTDDYVYLKNKGCVIDLGGIAKGYASEKIADLLRKNGVKSAIINLGGNVYVLGAKNYSENWKIGVRDPLEPDGTPALIIEVRDTSVITSGAYERYKIIDGKKYSHFFDAKTGKSVTGDLLSATLVTPDGSLADGLATAFMTAGYEKSLKIIENKNINKNTGIIFIRQNKNGNAEILASENLRDIILRAKYELKFF